MQNRIFKTLLCFTLAIAVFLSGTVFDVSPNSVLGYSQWGNMDNIIFADGDELTISGTNAIQYPYTTENQTTTLTAEIDSLAEYAIYGGRFIQSDENSTIESTTVIMSAGEVSTIYGGGYNNSSGDSIVGTANITMSGGEVATIYGSGYNNSTGSSIVSTANITITGGKVGNIYGVSKTISSSDASSATLKIALNGGEITGSVLAIEPESNVAVSVCNLSVSGEITLSGANSVIGSADYPITSISELSEVSVTSTERSLGDIVAYVSSGISEGALSYFTSDKYIFRLEKVSETVYAVAIAGDTNSIISYPSDILVLNGVTDSDNTEISSYSDYFQAYTMDLSEYTVYGIATEDVSSAGIMMNGGVVENIYGVASGISSEDISVDILLSGGDIKGEVLVAESYETSVGSYSFEIGLIDDLILSGDSPVIASNEFPVTSIYLETDSAFVIIENQSLEEGYIVAYFQADVLNEFDNDDDVLDYFSSTDDTYDFEIVRFEDNTSIFAVAIAEEETDTGTGTDPTPDTGTDPTPDTGTDPTPDTGTNPDTETDIVTKQESESSDEPLSSQYTVGGMSSLTIDDDKSEYYVDGKYDGGYYSSSEEAQKAQLTNQTKEDGEADVESFYTETFEGTGLEDDGYGLERYEEIITGLEEAEDGTYILDGEEFATLSEAVEAVKEQVNKEVYERNVTKLSESIANSAHYCDDADTVELISSGSNSISQLGYASAEKLSQLYAEVMDTIAVSQSILSVAETVEDTYNLLCQSGALTAESETALETYYQELLEKLQNAVTNSEVDEILASFEEYILSLEITKISLSDESGNIMAVISQSGGMEGGSQILLSEISDTAEYTALLESIIQSGDISADNLITRLFGVSNTLEDMSVLGAYDISIDSGTQTENGRYTVKVLAPDGMEGVGTVKILHITDYGIELISASLVDGYLIFETTSFSEFVVLGGKATSLWYALIPISILALLVCAYVYVSKKEEKGDGDNG